MCLLVAKGVHSACAFDMPGVWTLASMGSPLELSSKSQGSVVLCCIFLTVGLLQKFHRHAPNPSLFEVGIIQIKPSRKLQQITQQQNF